MVKGYSYSCHYFKTTRYAVILMAVITLHNYSKIEQIKINGTPFFNLYRLEKVADFISCDSNMIETKQAKKIYEDLERK